MSRQSATREPLPAAEAVLRAAGPRTGLARVWSWFWPKSPPPVSHPPAYEASVGRARAAADVARRAERDPEPFEHDVSAVICELYRESIHWSFLAFSAASRSSSQAGIVQRAVPEPELRARAEAAVGAGFEAFAVLPLPERQALASGLRRLAIALLAELEVEQRAVEAFWAQRVLRVGLVVVFFAALAGAMLKGLDRAERGRDLAAGAPWRASSVYGGASTCQSPQQDCAESPEYFFHTQEEQNPWVEFDLRSAQRVSGVRVENRADCCVDRVAPMVVEVSSDQEHWRKVARRDTTFAIWHTSFAPVTARWVRFRLDKRESLHLRGVRILRAGN